MLPRCPPNLPPTRFSELTWLLLSTRRQGRSSLPVPPSKQSHVGDRRPFLLLPVALITVLQLPSVMLLDALPIHLPASGAVLPRLLQPEYLCLDLCHGSLNPCR